MPHAVAMPKLGMTMREGTVLEYRVRPGDRVAKGETVRRQALTLGATLSF